LICNSITNSSSLVCGNHGDCVQNSTCVCDEGWASPWCETREYAQTCGLKTGTAYYDFTSGCLSDDNVGWSGDYPWIGSGTCTLADGLKIPSGQSVESNWGERIVGERDEWTFFTKVKWETLIYPHFDVLTDSPTSVYSLEFTIGDNYLLTVELEITLIVSNLIDSGVWKKFLTYTSKVILERNGATCSSNTLFYYEDRTGRIIYADGYPHIDYDNTGEINWIPIIVHSVDGSLNIYANGHEMSSSCNPILSYSNTSTISYNVVNDRPDYIVVDNFVKEYAFYDYALDEDKEMFQLVKQEFLVPSYYCFDKSCDDALACCGNGVCSARDTCECDAGFEGEDCCYTTGGAPPTCSPNCAVNGTCIDVDTCCCDEGWTGNLCDTPLCDPVCDHGTCNDTIPGLCDCDPGWEGDTCDTPVCDLTCSGNGKCVIVPASARRGAQAIHPECKCDVGWAGVACSTPLCDPDCGDHGTCNSTTPGLCDCDQDWEGDLCDRPVCDLTCSGNGTCVIVPASTRRTVQTIHTECDCDFGWDGPDCSVPVCIPDCSRSGTCVLPGICDCDEGWEGILCEIPTCTGITCSGNGKCVLVEGIIPFPQTRRDYGKSVNLHTECKCDFGNYGDDCEFQYDLTIHHYCYGIIEIDHPRVCNGSGDCIANNTCVCDDYYSGQECKTFNIPTCFGTTADDPLACGSHGDCVENDTCECDRHYSGAECGTYTIPICFGIAAHNESVCGGHGNCVATDTCQCEEYYFGVQCEENVSPICNGVSGLDPTVCDGYGDCVYSLLIDDWVCVCDEGSEDDGSGGCRVVECNAIPHNNPFVCSSNGMCLTHVKTCQCAEGWTGIDCEVPICDLKINGEFGVCNERGICISPNVCDCQVEGWGGLLCDQFVYGPELSFTCEWWRNGVDYFYDLRLACGPHGSCIAPDECLCNCDWYGDKCQYRHGYQRRMWCRCERIKTLFPNFTPWWCD
jgi:hypothetical protein